MFWNTIKGNINTINDIPFWYDILFKPVQACCEDREYVQKMLDILTPEISYDDWLQQLKDITGRKGKDLFHPIRLALTATEKGPELKKIFELLGYDAVKNRLENNLR